MGARLVVPGDVIADGDGDKGRRKLYEKLGLAKDKSVE